MNQKKQAFCTRKAILAIATAFLLIFTSVSFAQTTALWDGDNYNGSWSITGGGGSTDGFGWIGSSVPNGIDDIAQFDNNSYFAGGGSLYLTTDTSGTTASVQGGPVLNVTLGRIEHGGASSGRGFTLNTPSSGSAILTFDVSTGNAAIQNTTAGAANNGILINVDVLLNDNLDVLVQNVHSDSKDGVIFNQLVSGSNAITKSGAGLMRFKGSTGANTFSGGLTVSGGTVFAEKSGALGTGNVVIDNTGQLTIASSLSDTLSSSASISLFDTGILNLNSGVNQTVSGLFFDGVSQTTGTWGSTTSGALNTNDTWFTGTGTVTVIPEPSALALLGIGLSLLVLGRKHRR